MKHGHVTQIFNTCVKQRIISLRPWRAAPAAAGCGCLARLEIKKVADCMNWRMAKAVEAFDTSFARWRQELFSIACQLDKLYKALLNSLRACTTWQSRPADAMPFSGAIL